LIINGTVLFVLFREISVGNVDSILYDFSNSLEREFDPNYIAKCTPGKVAAFLTSEEGKRAKARLCPR